jgi:tetratricopeptide (TPR) repeat protein
LKQGPLGILPATTATLAGLTARLPTLRGQVYLYSLLVPVLLLGLLAAVSVLAFALVLRHGALLQHDIEEFFGSGRGTMVAPAVYAALLFLPLLTFQGWAWLPLWWLALLFLYLSRLEKVVCLAVLLSTLLVVPLVGSLNARLLAAENPLFRASVLAIEGGPDQRAIDDLERASQANADDRDLLYLLALQYKKAGRYDDAAALYRDVLKARPTEPIALNNLANIEFARGEPQAAIARYKQGIESAPGSEITATYYYNLSLAHLQRFEYQPHQEARSQADRLAPSLVAEYENLWRYGETAAVVDFTLSQDEVFAKFAGSRSGIARKNLAGAKAADLIHSLGPGDFLNRFSAFICLAFVVVLGISQWRGKRMFTMRCPKCGTPFCKRCHLGAATSGLCTQCYHLFVVRDGVSGPARNQKLLEVQKEDERRERLFRALSLLSPGAGHVYAQSVALGAVLLLAWYWVLALLLLAGRVVPVTEAPEGLLPRWPLFVAGLALLLIYVAANRARPDFDVAVPVRRSAPARRG